MSRSGEPKAHGQQLVLVGPTAPVHASSEIPQGVSKRVFVAAQVPTTALRNPLELPVVTAPNSDCATAFRLLARQVEHLGNTRRIVVTSPGANQGKSFAALNLGLALALGGAASVLLLEANFERPVLAKRIGFTPPMCLTSWLKDARQAPTGSFRAVEVCVPNLHVIAIDPAAQYTPGLLAVGFEAAVRQLCFSHYQYIIVDGPPVMGSADCSIIADSMDGVILCAAKGNTRVNEYREAVKQLEPVPVLGKLLIER